MRIGPSDMWLLQLEPPSSQHTHALLTNEDSPLEVATTGITQGRDVRLAQLASGYRSEAVPLLLQQEGTPFWMHHHIQAHRDALLEAHARLQREERAMEGSPGGPTIEALRARVVERARDLSGFLAQHAEAIGKMNNGVVNDIATRAYEAISQAPAARTDATVAAYVSTAAGALELAYETLSKSTGAPDTRLLSLHNLAKGAGALSFAASTIHHGNRLLGGDGPGRDGNVGDVIGLGGALMALIGTFRSSTPWGLGSIAVEFIGSRISDYLRGSADRTSLRDALVSNGVPRETADVLANTNPEVLRELNRAGVSTTNILNLAKNLPDMMGKARPDIIKELTDRGVPAARLLDIAAIAPGLFTFDSYAMNSATIAEIARWSRSGQEFTPRQIQQLQQWNNWRPKGAT
jgi:hypothetical protein